VRSHLATLVEDFRRHASETAVVAHRGNRRYPTTYGQLANLAGRFATELDRRNIVAGDRIILWGENSAEWIAAFFGCLLRGVIAVPLDAAGSADFASRVVKDVSPKLIAGDRSLLDSIDDIPHIPFSELTTQLPAHPNFTVSEAVNAQTPFQIIFTSGTTADPKGVVISHHNVLASLQPIEDEMAKYLKYERLVHPLRFLHSVPLSHVFGQFMGLWTPPLLAAEIHFAEQLEPARMTELIRRERISVLIAVPRVLHLLHTHLLNQFASLANNLKSAKGLSVWKRWWIFRRVHRALGFKFWAVISGGATLPSDLEDFWNTLGFALIQGYGMTETTALVTLNHPFRIGHGTIGKALPGREVRITDEGEILVRGDMLSSATWQGGSIRPRQSEWLATGDLAVQEETGELRFLGRKGDVIVTAAGMNIHPADLEEAMKNQPGVRECVVVPCNTIAGPEPVAVVLFTGNDHELHSAVEQTNRGLAEYQQIRRVLQWPDLQLPYTSTGKLLRRKVATWACATLAGQQNGSNLHGEDVLLKAIAEIAGDSLSNPSDQSRLSEDLHLDSLGRVQLQSALEQRLSLELEDDALASVETLGDLRALLAREAVHGSSLDSTAQSTLPNSQANVAPETTQQQEHVPVEPEHTYPHWPWSWPINALRIAFIELVMRPLVWLLGAPKVIHKTSNLPSAPILLIVNHVTAYDGALVLYALPPKLRRRVAIAMSGEMLLDLRRGRNQPNALANLLAPPAYWLITALFNVFPLPRLRGFRRSFAHAGEAMDQGYSVMIFPEGTRSPDGTLNPFRPGIGLLAQQSSVPVLPVTLKGLGEMRTGKSRWFRSGRLEIHVGEAIPIEETATPAELTATLEDTLRRLHSDQ
jgi:long-chain acyl-CoA synthetase